MVVLSTSRHERFESNSIKEYMSIFDFIEVFTVPSLVLTFDASKNLNTSVVDNLSIHKLPGSHISTLCSPLCS